MRLYLRIWLAVVFSSAALVLVVGYFWKSHTEHLRQEFREQMREQIRTQIQESIGRELPILDIQGNVVGRATPPPLRTSDAEYDPLVDISPTRRIYAMTLDDGQKLELLLPSRPQWSTRFIGPPAPWYFSPWGVVILLALLAIAVALGTYPIVRRLTKRLENLQHGVEQWGEGQLTTKVMVQGNDEVAFLAEKFNHAAGRVKNLMTAHKSLLANASHELRSPLARIRMALALLQSTSDKVLDANTKVTINEINHNILELDALIEEILLASRLDTPDASIGAPESFDLLGLAAEECSRVHAELVTPDGAVSTFEMMGYPRLIRRLMRNLLENANRHNNASRGGISLELIKTANAFIIVVQDHGNGVPSAECERIFEPFYRAKNTSERDGGVGLGLALVRSIAKRHGGTAVCEDTKGVGGKFVAMLKDVSPALPPMSGADSPGVSR